MIPQPGIYGWSTGNGGVHHYRQGEPLRVAGKHGIATSWGNQLDDEICERYDTILAHMLWDERNSQAWEKLARGGHHRLVFDIDDAMWEPDWKPFRDHYDNRVLARVWQNIAMAHVVTTPSRVIAEKVAQVNRNVHVCPNTVPEYLLKLQPPPRPLPDAYGRPLGRVPMPGALGLNAPVVIGYQGSPSHEHDFPPWLTAALLNTLSTNAAATLHFWGPDEIPGWPVDRVGHTPWQASVTEYYMSLSMDIGIGPLKPTPFNAAKSGLRAIEYAALGIPCVLSDGPAYRPWVAPSYTGYLATWKPGDWLLALSALIADPDLREKMGAEARKRAADWTTEACISTWVDAWGSA
jgi:hypothetical protein